MSCDCKSFPHDDWCDEHPLNVMRLELEKAVNENRRLRTAIDLAFFFRGSLPPLAREQCASVTEPLSDAYEELGIEVGSALLDEP